MSHNIHILPATGSVSIYSTPVTEQGSTMYFYFVSQANTFYTQIRVTNKWCDWSSYTKGKELDTVVWTVLNMYWFMSKYSLQIYDHKCTGNTYDCACHWHGTVINFKLFIKCYWAILWTSLNHLSTCWNLKKLLRNIYCSVTDFVEILSGMQLDLWLAMHLSLYIFHESRVLCYCKTSNNNRRRPTVCGLLQYLMITPECMQKIYVLCLTDKLQ